MRYVGLFLAAVLLAVIDIGAYAADAQADRMRQALRRAQDAARVAEQERATLAKAKEDLQATHAELAERSASMAAELEALRRAMGVERAKAAAAVRDLANAQKAMQEREQVLQTRSAALDEARGDASKLGSQLKATQADLGIRLAEKTQLSGELARVNKQLASCERDNAGLYQVGVELAEKRTGLSYWDGVMRREPVLGFGRVELENLMERYRDRLEPHRRARDDARQQP